MLHVTMLYPAQGDERLPHPLQLLSPNGPYKSLSRNCLKLQGTVIAQAWAFSHLWGNILIN